MMKAWLLLLAGCALTSRAQPLELRYFAPPSHVETAEHATAAGEQLRLGRVVAGDLLRMRIVHRDSSVEVAPYETLRWTDEPETYVRRALARSLFDAERLDQSVDSRAPTLDVDVVAFEEVRRGTRRLGRVELRYQVRDDHRVLARGSVAIERDAGPGIESVVAAIGQALDAAAAEVAGRVATTVASR